MGGILAKNAVGIGNSGIYIPGLALAEKQNTEKRTMTNINAIKLMAYLTGRGFHEGLPKLEANPLPKKIRG